MPIKEFVNWAWLIVVGIAVTGGPQNLTKNLRVLEYKMLKEVGRTSNWGDPNIFRYKKFVVNHKKY